MQLLVSPSYNILTKEIRRKKKNKKNILKVVTHLDLEHIIKYNKN